jgi:predicted phage terminase large subunit-like protein
LNLSNLTIEEQKELEHLLESEYLDKVRNSYVDYVEYVHEGQWLKSKHLELVCNTVQNFLEDKLINKKGQVCNVLLIAIPPQHGKSQTITETLPSWYLGKHPDKRIIEVSYGDDLARKFGRRNKQKINEYGKKLFNIEISSDTRSDTEFEIKGQRGSMISRGIMAGLTGQPGDLICIDDPIKNRQESDSETYRERIWEEWLNSIKTRLSAKGKVIIIQTRWHEDDLSGRILKDGTEKYYELNIPCEAEENDILGRNVGDALFPEIGKDNEWLQDFKKSYIGGQGSRAWNALFQGKPVSQEGNLLKREWWQYYDKLPPMVRKIISVDAAFKGDSNSDFVVIQVWGKTGANMYLIDQHKARMDFPTTLQAIRNMIKKHPDAHAKFIEDKANGSAIVSMLRREIGGIIPVNPQGGKVSRVNSVSAYIESGNVYLPRSIHWLDDFLNEASAFPNGKNDDSIDAMSQALNRLIYYYADIPEASDPDNPTPQERHQSAVNTMTGGKNPSFISRW